VEFAGLTIEADRIDPLTGLLQRGAFESVLARSFSLGRTSGESVTLVQVHVGGIPRAVTRADVDAADQTIITVTALLRKHFEPMGAALCRWAGDTFAAAVVGAERTAVARTAGEFRADLERSSDHLRAGVTVSIGVAVADSGTIAHYASPQQLVASALAAANAARQAGGNCVRTFVPRAAA
jgi:diguanylate cyclase (GGDEF)-like protein